MATFPSSVQQGKSVFADAAAKMDEDGFALLLGFYDCRFSSSQEERKQTNLKKEGGGGTNCTKRVLAGRTRLVWTAMSSVGVVTGDEAGMARNRVIYLSLLTGQRLDAAVYVKFVALWSRASSFKTCSYVPLDEEIQSAWDIIGELLIVFSAATRTEGKDNHRHILTVQEAKC
eukprot:1260055-Ditylum_brightwellii.AAC.1